MKAKEFDKKFEEDEDITGYLELSSVRRPVQQCKRVNVDFPIWIVQRLDKESRRLGIPRQSLIKLWVAEHLEKAA